MVTAMIKIMTLTQTPMQKERLAARAVYRIFDVDGSLLYVGMSGQPMTRIQMHAKRIWFSYADRAEIRWHKTKQSALDAEAVSIIMDKPKFNLACSLVRVCDTYLPIVSVRISRSGRPKEKTLWHEATKGSAMIYTVDELKRLIPKNEIADAARFCGMSYSSLWRIWEGKQEPREGTLVILKSYVETIYDPR